MRAIAYSPSMIGILSPKNSLSSGARPSGICPQQLPEEDDLAKCTPERQPLRPHNIVPVSSQCLWAAAAACYDGQAECLVKNGKIILACAAAPFDELKDERR